MTTSIYDNIFNHGQFNKTIDNLIYNEFIKYENLRNRKLKIPPENLRKAGWLASILANSPIEEHKQRAQFFASLVYLQSPDDISAQQLSYVINSRSGNLTATRFLGLLFNKAENIANQTFAGSFGAVLDEELASERFDKIISLNQQSFLATDFQKHLWENLSNETEISVSAPTSSGKSFIIQKFIQNEFFNAQKMRVLYIVSSRALLAQVSEEFRRILDLKVEVKTSFVFAEGNELFDKQIFILTPERCLRLLQEKWRSDFFLDIVFVDEIQNVENEEGRGVLMEYVLNEISDLFPKAKMVTAGPFINNNQQVFNDLLSKESREVKTNKSPVFQIKTIISPLPENHIGVEILSLNDSAKRTGLRIPVDFDPQILVRNNGKFISRLVQLFGKKGQSIIYSPKTDLAQKWALHLANISPAPTERPKELNELTEFLEDEIHPKYFLIECLKKGIAFHHSRLPDIVRKEIEDLYIDNKIQNLFCTSTLLEGVNLPANNLFLITPKKKIDSLTSFEFGNLIGRAGRIRDSLFGTIYCVQRINETWAEDYYSRPFNKEVISANQKALSNIESLLPELAKASTEIKDVRNQGTVVFLRHKFLKSEEELVRYLQRKNVGDNLSSIIRIIRESTSRVNLNYETVRLNPSIDPILQNRLFNEIKKDGIDSWCVIVNSNFYKRIRKENVAEYKMSELSLFWQLSLIVEKLDKIFEIGKEAYFRHDISLSIRSMCIYGSQWLENKSYKELILEDLRFNARHINAKKRIDMNNEITVNERINEVIKIHSTVITYILVKYLKVLNDIISGILGENPDEKYRFSLALPTMLELGTTKAPAIQLISRGVNRSVALKVVQQFERIQEQENIDIFDWLKTQETLRMKPIYNRYLRRLNLLKSVTGSTTN